MIVGMLIRDCTLIVLGILCRNVKDLDIYQEELERRMISKIKVQIKKNMTYE